MPWFRAELGAMLTVAAAVLDQQGALIEANAGFLRIVEQDGPRPIGANMARFFIQPNFSTLANAKAGVDGTVHNGLLTFGEYTGRTQSLRARVWRVGGQIRVLAEYDIEELQRVFDTVLELNRDYASAQLDLAQTNLRLQQREAHILRLSLTDPLTGVGNRRHLEQALAQETARAERTGGTLCAFMADLDHFKRVNDIYGHETGDKLLAAFGKLLRQHTRTTDIVARFGGEEFVVLIPHTNLEDAAAAADRLRQALASARVEPLPNPVTVSIGVAELAAGERGEALLRRADKALYEAKQSGRNRVIIGH